MLKEILLIFDVFISNYELVGSASEKRAKFGLRVVDSHWKKES